MTLGRLNRLFMNIAVVGIILIATQPGLRQNVIASAVSGTPGIVRVGMWTLWHDREIGLTPVSNATIQTCARCSARTLSKSETIRASGDSVVRASGNHTQEVAAIWLKGAVTLKAHGEVETLRFPVMVTARAGILVIVVSMPLESYVQRVVASESGDDDSAESLKALAVVVRSFALHESHGHADYDLCDSTHCQLLRWHSDAVRISIAESAALATSGETLWFKGQRALSYFHKDCGGRTAQPNEIWPRATGVAYLPSQADRYCSAGGSKGWRSELTLTEITTALKAAGIAAPGWQHLTVERRGESGRAVSLRLDEKEVPAEDFRIAVGKALGWNRVPSTWFEVSQKGDSFFFRGRGWGHGVGLCQTGAAAMAAQGHKANDILSNYFPGTDVNDELTGDPWKSFAGQGLLLQSLDASDAIYLPEIERARSEAERVSGLSAPESFMLRAFPSTTAFRDATLAPGWIAAFTQGSLIASQPLRTLSARGLLQRTMRHEFLHALVEREAGPRAPLWFREGLVELWGGGCPADALMKDHAPQLTLDAIDALLAHSASERESQAAHRAACERSAGLINRYGRTTLLSWLHSGLPDGIVQAVPTAGGTQAK